MSTSPSKSAIYSSYSLTWPCAWSSFVLRTTIYYNYSLTWYCVWSSFFCRFAIYSSFSLCVWQLWSCNVRRSAIYSNYSLCAWQLWSSCMRRSSRSASRERMAMNIFWAVPWRISLSSENCNSFDSSVYANSYFSRLILSRIFCFARHSDWNKVASYYFCTTASLLYSISSLERVTSSAAALLDSFNSLSASSRSYCNCSS